ncbi:hypothetical protein BH24ACT10_BH24ACT10_16540 [soil metagenome]
MTELSAPARLGAFGAALLVVLVASFGIGRVTGDVEQAPAPISDSPMRDHGEAS